MGAQDLVLTMEEISVFTAGMVLLFVLRGGPVQSKAGTAAAEDAVAAVEEEQAPMAN